ncbi:MAG TPA: tetratricopeptide repeat protein [Pyrinomonadaceae bacterium]
MSLRTLQPLSSLPRLLFLTAVLFALQLSAQAQGIGAHKGDRGGGTAGGTRSIQGHIISPTGRLPETRIRISVSSSNGGVRSATAGEDGVFIINNLEPGPYELTIDAGGDFELVRESVYLGGLTEKADVPVYLRLKPEANPALAGVPKSAVALYVQAQESARKGDNAKAQTLLADAVAQHPTFGLAHNELAMIHMKAGALDKASEEIKLASKSLPDDSQVQLNYGIISLERKDYPEAEKQLRRSLKRMDKSAQAHMYLGVALMRLKAADADAAQRNQSEAEREFQQAIKHGGDSAARAHYYLGGLYWARRDYKKAADALETYVRLAPKAPDAEQVKGTIKELRSKS